MVEFSRILPRSPCQTLVLLGQQLPAVESMDPNRGLRTGRHENGHSDPQLSNWERRRLLVFEVPLSQAKNNLTGKI